MISVVIVTYNSEACVGACIDALASSLPDAEILVIDNASTDDSRAVAARHGTTVVELPENVGFGRACNVGAGRAHARAHPFPESRREDPTRWTPAICSSCLARRRSVWWCRPRRAGSYSRSVHGGGRRSRKRWGRCGPVSFPGICTRAAQVKRYGRPELHCSCVDPSSSGLGDSILGTSCTSRTVTSRGDIARAGLAVRSTPSLIAEHSLGGSSEIGDRRSELLAYSLMGWLQYTYVVSGSKAAARAWRLARTTHRATVFSVEMAARIIPSARLRRKRLQLHEVTGELSRISASSGVLKQSDAWAYWPDAVALLGRTS